MSSERRLIRPFKGVGAFGGLLSNVRFRLANERIMNGEKMSVTSNSLLHDPPMIEFAPQSSGEKLRLALVEASNDANIPPEDLELLVILSTPYLKLSDVAFRACLSDVDAIPDIINIRQTGLPARALDTPVGGVDILVVVCLSSEREPQPLRPHRKGTWLGRSSFKLRTELGELGLTPVPLNDEVRKSLGLGPNTSRYVQVDDPEAFREARLDDALTLYVDEQVLASVSKNPDSPAARNFQCQLFLDAMGAVVTSCAGWQDLQNLGIDDLQGSVLGSFVKAGAIISAESSERDSLEESLHVLRTEPLRFLARLDDKVGAADILRTAVGELEE